jgi:hypothetical protein
MGGMVTWWMVIPEEVSENSIPPETYGGAVGDHLTTQCFQIRRGIGSGRDKGERPTTALEYCPRGSSKNGTSLSIGG